MNVKGGHFWLESMFNVKEVNKKVQRKNPKIVML